MKYLSFFSKTLELTKRLYTINNQVTLGRDIRGRNVIL